jgi:hypothetical protein
MTKRTIKDVGLTPDQIEYLVGHSQEIYPPSDFDDEVQRYLDEWTINRTSLEEDFNQDYEPGPEYADMIDRLLVETGFDRKCRDSD